MSWNFVSSLAIVPRRRVVATAIVYGLSLAVRFTSATGEEMEIPPQAVESINPAGAKPEDEDPKRVELEPKVKLDAPLLVHPISCPPCISYYTLPEHYIWLDWIKGRPGYRIDLCVQEPNNMLHLICGSEGTLAAITSAEVKIVRRPTVSSQRAAAATSVVESRT